MTVHLQNSLWKLRTSSNALYKSVYKSKYSLRKNEFYSKLTNFCE